MKKRSLDYGPGVTRYGRRRRAFVRVDGTLRTTSFALDTLPSVIQAWRESQRGTAAPVPEAGSFAADVASYTPTLTIATAPRAVYYLALWVRALGADRASASITSQEITDVMARWKVTPTIRTGPRGGRASGPKGLAPGSIRKRHRYLFAFFKWRFGAAGINPARGATPPKQPKPEARAIAYRPGPTVAPGQSLADILAAMSRYRTARVATATDKPAKARLIAAVIAYTGVPPGMLMDVRREDLTLTPTGAAIRVRARLKGGGVEPRTYPLGGEALAACRAWDAANVYGRFAIQSVNRAFQRAAEKCGVPRLRFHLYDLRHSFGTQLYRVTKDRATVARLMGHVPGSTVTDRYTEAAHAEVDAAAVANFLPAPAPSPVTKLPTKVTTRRKLRKVS